MLKIKNLSVKVHNKQILKGVDLEIKKGKIHALLGPNASGKSTLAYTLMGLSKYKITSGAIYFKKKNITNLKIEKRAKLGISLAFQHPPVIKEVILSNLLDKITKQSMNIKELSLKPEMLKRGLNFGFSGGERKLSEILQIINMRPSLVVFDELDSGLDLKNVARLAKVIKNKLLKKNVSVLLITHSGNILSFLEPDAVHVMLKGKIICSSDNWKKVWKTIKGFDYEKCKKCEFHSK